MNKIPEIVGSDHTGGCFFIVGKFSKAVFANPFDIDELLGMAKNLSKFV